MDAKVGDVVQLKSGGAPLTVVLVESLGWRKGQAVSLVSMSVGGLLQDAVVHSDAVVLYSGEKTRGTR